MLHPEEKTLILKFLSRNYTVRRIKHNMRFKRAIYHNGQFYLLSDKESFKNLYYQLLDELKLIFDTSKDINEEILKAFLHIK